MTAEQSLKAVDSHLSDLKAILTEDVRILMVEDDRAQILVYEILFKRFDALVTYAMSAKAALELLSDCCPYDVVMIDLRLNNCLSGVDVLNRCDRYPDCEPVVVTGDISQLQTLGYDGVATVCFKPLTFEKLAKILRKVGLPKEGDGTR